MARVRERARDASRPPRPRRRLAARAAWVLTALLVLAGCTDPGEPTAVSDPGPSLVETPPAPPPPPVPVSAVVVLPPSGSLAPAHAAQVADGIDDVIEGGDVDVRDVRSVVPDGPAFTADLARTFADRGSPLVCVLGPGAEDVLEPLVVLHPDVRFCALPASLPDEPDDDDPGGRRDPVLRAELRAEELGHVVGLAAREHAAGLPVGLSLTGDELPAARLRRGVVAGLDGVEVVELRGDPEARAATLRERDIRTLVVDGGADNAELVEQLPAEVAIAGPRALLDGLPHTRHVATWDVRWSVPVAWAIARSGPEGSGPRHASFGFADTVLTVVPGAALSPALASELDAAIAAIAAGERDPHEAAPDPPEPVDGADVDDPVS
jgi:hypothetical protein